MADPAIAIYSLTVPLVWQYIGVYLVIFLAGRSNIPNELLEAAEIDGAVGLKRTRYIILPLLVSTIRVVCVLAISGTLKVFEQPYIMTRGGPGVSTTVLAYYAYSQSFEQYRFPYGSTIAVGILLISFLAIVAMTTILGGTKSNYEY